MKRVVVVLVVVPVVDGRMMVGLDGGGIGLGLFRISLVDRPV